MVPQEYLNVSELAEKLPANVDALVPPGIRTGEVWLRAGKILVVCDGLFYFGPLSLGPVHLLLRITGGVPGLRVSRVFLYMAVNNISTYRSWLNEVLPKNSPQIMAPSHGHILNDAKLGERLLALV